MDDTRTALFTTTSRYLPSSLTWNIDESTELMTYRDKPTLTRFQTNSLFTPMDSTQLHHLSSVCCSCACACCMVLRQKPNETNDGEGRLVWRMTSYCESAAKVPAGL